MRNCGLLGFLVVSASLLAGVTGCGAPADALDRDDGEVAEVSEAILDTALDRPPEAAGISVGVDGIRQLWVYACSPVSRVLRRKVLSAPWGTWGTWRATSGTDKATCAGTPAVGSYPTQPADSVEVFYRGMNDELFELYTDSNGVKAVVNLSQELGIGPIAGDPVIADMASNFR